MNRLIQIVGYFLGVFVLTSSAIADGSCRTLKVLKIDSTYTATTHYPETGLIGLRSFQVEQLLHTLRQVYGENLIDVYVIGSRAAGKKGFHKQNSPITETSDIDMVLHLKSDLGSEGGSMFGEASRSVAEADLIPFPVQLLTTSTPGNNRISGSLTTFLTDNPASFQIIPKATPVAQRSEFVAIRISEE